MKTIAFLLLVVAFATYESEQAVLPGLFDLLNEVTSGVGNVADKVVKKADEDLNTTLDAVQGLLEGILSDSDATATTSKENASISNVTAKSTAPTGTTISATPTSS